MFPQEWAFANWLTILEKCQYLSIYYYNLMYPLFDVLQRTKSPFVLILGYIGGTCRLYVGSSYTIYSYNSDAYETDINIIRI